ncbi:MAG: hypothetical protein II359_03065 [Clostridia bacterium]|nr:hypothetical protein [Clostridia bacterium]
MIEQQIFTKGEKTLVKNTYGLDTVAKSAGLENNYIVNQIHPYCVYNVPDPLFLEDKDMPVIQCHGQMVNGDAIINRSVSKSAGNENTYLTHSFILKKGTPEWESYIKNPDNFLFVSGFASDFAPGSSTELPQLTNMPIQTGRKRLARKDLLKRLKTDEAAFKKIVTAIFMALEKKRKVFIALKNEDREWQTELLWHIYNGLPYAVRRAAGYSTFYYQEEIPFGIEVYFIHPKLLPESANVIKIGERSTAKDYIFDFRSGNFMHLDFESTSTGEFLTEWQKSDGKLTDFFNFCERVTAHMPQNYCLRLRFYDDLMLLYKLSDLRQDEIMTYAGRILIFLGEMLSGSEGNEAFISLYRRFIKIYEEALAKAGVYLNPEALKRMIAQHQEACPEICDVIASSIAEGLEHCIEAGDTDKMCTYMDIIRSSEAFYMTLIKEKLLERPLLLNTYMCYQLEQKRTTHALFEFSDKTLATIPEVFFVEAIQKEFFEKAIELYDAAGDRYIAIKHMEEKCSQTAAHFPELSELYNSVYFTALEKFMNSVTLSGLLTDHIMDFSLEGLENLSEEAQVKQNTILAMKEVLSLTLSDTTSFIPYDDFGFEYLSYNICDDHGRGLKAEAEIRQKLWTAMRGRKVAAPRAVYPVLYFAALAPGEGEVCDFEKIFKYIDDNLDADINDFINWYMSSKLFLEREEDAEGKISRKIPMASDEPDTAKLQCLYDAVLSYFRRNGSVLADRNKLQRLRKNLVMPKAYHSTYKKCAESFDKSFMELARSNVSLFSAIGFWAKRNHILPIVLIVLLIGALLSGGVLLAKHLTDKKEQLPPIEIESTETVEASAQGVSWLQEDSWAAYISAFREGEIRPASGLLDGEETVFDFASDENITITFGGAVAMTGITVVFEGNDEQLAATDLKYAARDDANHLYDLEYTGYENGTVTFSLAENKTVSAIVIRNTAAAGAENKKLTITDISAFVR